MKNKNEVLKNKYFLFWTKFFVEINALNAVVQLFYLKRGLNPSEILYLGIAWSIATLAFEIPTGYLADLVGRKRTIVLGVMINIVANLLMFAAHGFWPFAIVTTLLSLSFACFSGTEDALIYDSLREVGDEKSILRVSGKYLSSARAAKIFTPFIGALIAQNLTNFQFNILLSINAVSSLLALATSSKLVEPDRFIDVSEKEIGVFGDSLQLIKKNPDLVRIILNKTLVFIGIFVFWKIYQPLLTGIGFSVFYLGLLYFIFQTILTLVYWHSEYLKSKLGGLMIFQVVPILAFLFAAYVFVGTNKWLIYVSSMGILMLGSVRDPYFTEIVQKRLRSYNRATSTSIFNLFKGVFDIPILFVSGILANSGIKSVMWVSIFLFAFSALFLQIKQSDLTKNDIGKK